MYQEHQIELLCRIVEDVMAKHGYEDTPICGGYVNYPYVLLSINGVAFLSAIAVRELERRLKCKAIVTSGVVMLDAPIIGSCDAVVECMDINQLVDLHQQEMKAISYQAVLPDTLPVVRLPVLYAGNSEG